MTHGYELRWGLLAGMRVLGRGKQMGEKNGTTVIPQLIKYTLKKQKADHVTVLPKFL